MKAAGYDMLCFEGIAMNLNVFRGKIPMPQFQLLDIPPEKMHTITVSKDTGRVRPFVAGAILRDVTFDKAVYDSFISLQDKLHQNLARQRTLYVGRLADWEGGVWTEKALANARRARPASPSAHTISIPSRAPLRTRPSRPRTSALCPSTRPRSSPATS